MASVCQVPVSLVCMVACSGSLLVSCMVAVRVMGPGSRLVVPLVGCSLLVVGGAFTKLS